MFANDGTHTQSPATFANGGMRAQSPTTFANGGTMINAQPPVTYTNAEKTPIYNSAEAVTMQENAYANAETALQWNATHEDAEMTAARANARQHDIRAQGRLLSTET